MIDFENLEDKLIMSSTYQNDPLIVIIDPVDSKQEILRKMERFNCLSKKFRALSNAYSYNIYGMNVLNMYNYMIAKYDTLEYESSTGAYNTDIPVDESVIVDGAITEADSLTSIAEASYDFMNDAFIKRDALMMGKYLTELNALNENQRSIVESRLDGIAKLDDMEYNPQIPSWYTPTEIMLRFNQPVDPAVFSRNYLRSVKEALMRYTMESSEDNKNKVLSLGWNYYVPVNENTVKICKEHNGKHYACTSIYDIISLMEDVEAPINPNDDKFLEPIYFIETYDKKRYLSCQSNLGYLIRIYGDRIEGCNGVVELRDAQMQDRPIEVYVAFIRADICKYMSNALTNEDDGLGLKTNISSLLNYELKPSDDYMKFYTGLIETIISDVYYSLNPTGEIDFKVDEGTKTIYKIYGGSAKNYDRSRVNDIVNVLTYNIKQPLESKGIVGEALDLMIEKLTPHSII